MSTFRLLPYKLGTESGKELIRSLDGLIIHPTRGTYRRHNAHRIINWGNSGRNFDGLFRDGDFNHPAAVGLAVDKLCSFEIWRVNGVYCPEYTSDRAVSERWLQQDGIVIGRDTATGARGDGITVYSASNPRGSEGVSNHLFYVRFARSIIEYRIHIGRSNVIDIAQKKRRNGHRDANPIIRNHENGWVFCRNNIISPSADTIDQARKAILALGLDFGAVDICVTKEGTPTVFEVNTAPGIEGTTLSKYRDFFAQS